MKREMRFFHLLALAAIGCGGVAEPQENVSSREDDLRIRICGGPSTKGCGDRNFCNGVLPGRCPGAAKIGLCSPRPEICTDLFQPVCGCDGRTYSNSCAANRAGVSVSSQGECPTSQFCGGIAGIPCPGRGVCIDDPTDSCDPNNGGADCGGICSCVQNVLCIRGSHFDSSPAVCACVPDAP